ncbi:MAG: RluA family pseudouridine synthase [Alphaproteobacteria bacterium]|nr:RluA family pseudouridine synthase [Alphaproteobacteria bacterium]
MAPRLDLALLPLFQLKYPELTRNTFQRLIEAGALFLENTPITKCNIKVTEGTYSLSIPDLTPSHILPKAMPMDIIFHDEDIIVINKPAYLSVHPGAGNSDHTLVNGLLHEFGESLSGIGGIQRPGIVHRLDKDTSGLMVIAKNDLAHQKLSAQFEDRTLSRTYIAFVFGIPSPRKGTIETHIARHPTHRQKMAVSKGARGKIAITHYKVLERFMIDENPIFSFSKVECKLQTGRTHQIRVHMHHMGHPIIGDPVYGKSTLSKKWPEIIKNFPRQALHAAALQFAHPRTNELMTFSAPLPDDMLRLAQLSERMMGEG